MEDDPSSTRDALRREIEATRAKLHALEAAWEKTAPSAQDKDADQKPAAVFDAASLVEGEGSIDPPVMQTIFNSIDQAIVVYDEDNCLQSWNRHYQDLLDFPDKLLQKGRHLIEILEFQAHRGTYGSGDPKTLAQNRLHDILDEGPRPFETKVKRGQTVLDVRRYKLKEGGFIGIFTDITRLTQREQELAATSALLRTALENMDQGLCVFNQHFEVLAWNDTFTDLFSFPPDLIQPGCPLSALTQHLLKHGEMTEDQINTLIGKGNPSAPGDELRAHTIVKPDGRSLDVRVRPFPKGGWVVTFTDMTERRRTEREVEENWQLLAAIVETVPCALAVKNADGKFLYANEEIAHQFGWEPEELIGKTIHDVLGEEADSLIIMDDFVVRTGLPLSGKEIEITLPDQQTRTYVVKLNPLFDEEEKTKAVVTAALDISHHKRIARELVAQSQLLHTMLNSIDQGFVGFDEDFQLFAWNNRWRELCGCPDDFLHIGTAGQKFRDYFSANPNAGVGVLKSITRHPGETRDVTIKSLTLAEFCLAELSDTHYEVVTEAGDVFDVRRFPVSGKGYVATFTDVTERRRREQEIENHQQLLRTTFDAIRDGLACFDAQHRLLLWNERFFASMSYPHVLAEEGSPYQLFLTADSEAGHPADQKNNPHFTHAQLEKIRQNQALDFEWQRHDGRILRYRSYPIPGGGFVISTTDITRGKRQELMLRQSEARLSFLSENAEEGVIVHDGNQIVDVNNATVQISGRDIGALRGMPLEYIVTMAERDRLARMLAANRDERQEFEGLRSNGEVFPLEVQSKGRTADYDALYLTARPEKGQTSRHTDAPLTRLILIRDISERKRVEEERARLESQLRQSQKLEAIGTLAGGIAHDFNNVLGSILGYAEMAVGDEETGDRPKRYVTEVLKAANRAKDLVDRILSFSRRGESRREPLDLSEAIGEAIQLLRPSIPSTIQIICDECQQGAILFADPTEIHQILVNLVNNAAQAMPMGGAIRLESSCEDLLEPIDPNIPESETLLQKKIRLAVIDNGTGIEAPVIDRIFDPFFTTKDVGVGTGLGLAVVHRLVTAHGGSIEVSSRVGQGTRFDLIFPFHHGEDLKPPTDEEDPLANGHGEVVLVVDDEPQLVDVCKEMLGDLGYTVVCHNDSLAALTDFRAQPNHYDLILTDQTMPNMTGLQLAIEARKIKTETPILLMTGYSRATISAQARAAGVYTIIRKPFTFRDLAHAIERALAQT